MLMLDNGVYIMYKYSDGTVRPAKPFVYNDVQYGVDVFYNWTPAQLASVGVKEFIEDVVPQFYDGGVPVDVETETRVHRTYPNAVYNPALELAYTRANATNELAILDTFVPRSVEDLCGAVPALWDALPEINKERILRKRELRQIISGVANGNNVDN